jgi:hypothetical protein
MRALAFISILALAGADTNRCFQALGDGAMIAGSDLLDAAVDTWAAAKRCGKTGPGDTVICIVDAASAIEATASVANAVVKIVDGCGQLHDKNKACGMEAGELMEAIAGLTASSAAIAQYCPPNAPGFQQGTFPVEYVAGCTVGVKDSVKQLFKAVSSIMELKKCQKIGLHKCPGTALMIFDAIAGLGAYLSGALGNCEKVAEHLTGMNNNPGAINNKAALCSKAAFDLARFSGQISTHGLGLSKKCAHHDGRRRRRPHVRPTVTVTYLVNSARLYSEDDTEAPAATGNSPNFVVVALMPFIAIASFVGGQFYGRRRAARATQARAILSNDDIE